MLVVGVQPKPERTMLPTAASSRWGVALMDEPAAVAEMVAALYDAFDTGNDLTTEGLLHTLKDLVPLASTMRAVGAQAARKPKRAGSEAIRATSGSISKKVQFSPGRVWQASEPVPRPIAATAPRRPPRTCRTASMPSAMPPPV